MEDRELREMIKSAEASIIPSIESLKYETFTNEQEKLLDNMLSDLDNALDNILIL